MDTRSIVVHGGAGKFSADRFVSAREACEAARDAGAAVLEPGGTCVEAVVAAVRILEDAAVFNAGVGSVLNREGQVELDAAVMDGATLRFGGVCAMPPVRHPIDVAWKVLTDGEHVLLAGEGAARFAAEHGIARVSSEALVTPLRRQHYLEESERRARGQRERDPGTVGACACDRYGQVAAATSTGGVLWKRVGRVGDSPICGQGTYADEGCAVSATGHGEEIARTVLAFRIAVGVAAATRADDSPQTTLAQALEFLRRKTAGTGGAVLCTPDGGIAAAHTTSQMPHAWGRWCRGSWTEGADVVVTEAAAAHFVRG